MKVFNSHIKSADQFIEEFDRIFLRGLRIEQLNTSFDVSRGITIDVLRLDTLQKEFCGNKPYKLKYNLAHYYSGNFRSLLTFGGPYSNHILATASIGHQLGIKTIGVIRGGPYDKPSPVLRRAAGLQMQLCYLSRVDYRRKNEDSYLQHIRNKFDKSYIVPEGGTNELAVKGVAELADNLKGYDFYVMACGTGGTVAGMIRSLSNTSTVVGIPVLKNKEELFQVILRYNQSKDYTNYQLIDKYHFGGYAKKNKILDEFISRFHEKYQFPIDFVYTGKLFFGLFDLLKTGFFPKCSRVLVIHSGGIIL